ncbi:MAG: hypothetical protein R2695_12275 [Acidimicrobiales bacterium]
MVRITGTDAATYLQGQISQDVTTIAAGESAWSLLLDPSGKLISWFRLHRLGDHEFLADLEPATVDRLVARLRRFVLRTDVEFESEPDWRMLSVRAATPAELDVSAVADVEGLRAGVDWPGFVGVDVLGAALGVPAGWVFDEPAVEALRVRAGFPTVSADLDDDTIPAEMGPGVIVRSVSFDKGCYTGQELVARVDSRGNNVPRPLRRLEGDADLVVGAEIRSVDDGEPVGTLSSAAGPHGLARVRRRVEPGSRVTVGGIGAIVVATPTESHG